MNKDLSKITGLDSKIFRVCLCGCNKTFIYKDSRGRTRKYIHGHNSFNRGHGQSKSPTYTSWQEMKRRCYKENRQNYVYYGGRGIKVSDRWIHSFENFYKDMGEKPSIIHTLDRIDNDGDYTPENCKWSTPKEQSMNRRSTKNAI